MSIEQPLTRPPRTNHLPFVVLLGGPAVLALIIFTLGYRYSVSARAQNVTMGDRTYLVTVPELLDVVANTDGYDPKAEVLRKVLLPRGGRELEYRYAGVRPSWLVHSRVIVEADETQALATYAQLSDRELSAPGLVLESRAFAWGHEAQLGNLLRNGAAVGHYFLARKANRVVMYRVEGLVLAAPKTFEAVVTSHLQLAETFAP